MSMTVLHRSIALVAVLSLAGAARADRYRITVGAMPPCYVNDASTYASQLGGLDPALEPSTPETVPVPPSAPPPPAAEAPADRDRGAESIASPPPDKLLQMPADADDAHLEEDVPPSPEFLGEIAGFYFFDGQPEIKAVWKWYRKEPATLGFKERTANAVIRQIISQRGPLVASSTARLDGLKPDATRATVRSANGVQLRGSPWGPINGGLLAGDSVEITPPAIGPWYNVTGRGWTCGLWLDLR